MLYLRYGTGAANDGINGNLLVVLIVFILCVFLLVLLVPSSVGSHFILISFH